MSCPASVFFPKAVRRGHYSLVEQPYATKLLVSPPAAAGGKAGGAGGLAALLHHLLFRHEGTTKTVGAISSYRRVAAGDRKLYVSIAPTDQKALPSFR